MAITLNLQLTRIGLRVLLGAFPAEPQALAEIIDNGGVRLRLFTAWGGFDLDMTTASMVQPTFTGYSPPVLSLEAAGLDPEGRPRLLCECANFTPSGDNDSDPIIGAGLVGVTGGSEPLDNLTLGAGIFSQAIPLNQTTESLTVVPIITAPLDVISWGVWPATA